MTKKKEKGIATNEKNKGRFDISKVRPNKPGRVKGSKNVGKLLQEMAKGLENSESRKIKEASDIVSTVQYLLSQPVAEFNRMTQLPPSQVTAAQMAAIKIVGGMAGDGRNFDVQMYKHVYTDNLAFLDNRRLRFVIRSKSIELKKKFDTNTFNIEDLIFWGMENAPDFFATRDTASIFMRFFEQISLIIERRVHAGQFNLEDANWLVQWALTTLKTHLSDDDKRFFSAQQDFFNGMSGRFKTFIQPVDSVPAIPTKPQE